MTARSESGSSPTSSAAATRPSGRVTSRALAPPATWLLVTMYPSGVMTNPDPEPACALRPRAPRSTRMWATAGATWATTPVTALEYASSISASAARAYWRAGTASRASSATAKGKAARPWREEAIDWKMVARAAAFKRLADRCLYSRPASPRYVRGGCAILPRLPCVASPMRDALSQLIMDMALMVKLYIMRINVILTSVVLLLSLATFSSVTVAATTVVNVLLEDSSSDPTIGNMRISLDHATVTAGRVTFRATNRSKNLIHEMIVVKVDPKKPALPYDEKKTEVIEKKIQNLGEISNLKPGAAGAMTLSLKPGSYVLICNQPGHYKAGMVANLLVNK